MEIAVRQAGNKIMHSYSSYQQSEGKDSTLNIESETLTMIEVQSEASSVEQSKIISNSENSEQTTDNVETNIKLNAHDISTEQMNPNFWQEGNYKKVTRRIEDGAKSTEEFSKLIQERAEIENLYATKLKAWQKKWLDNISRTNEYGSVLDCFKSTLNEGGSLCDLHQSIHGRLMELSTEIQQWKVQRYPKSLTKYKELRRSEEAFSKAQGPWVVKCKEVTKCMKSYHSARHTLDILNEQHLQLKSDSTEITQDQINKINTKIKKSEVEVENWKNRYDDAIRDVTTYNPKYIQDMKYEFDNCQSFEKVRREFTKEKLAQFVSYVDRRIFSENYEKLYSEIYGIHSTINVDEDLGSYRNKYGPEHTFKTLEFIEYDPSKFETNKVEPKPSPKQNKGSGVCTAL